MMSCIQYTYEYVKKHTPVGVGWHTLGRPPVEIVRVFELPHSGDNHIVGRKRLSYCAFLAAHDSVSWFPHQSPYCNTVDAVKLMCFIGLQ
jgi:hypothetical protein